MNVCLRLYNFGRNYLIISSFMILLYKYTVYIFSSFGIALFVRTGLSHSMIYDNSIGIKYIVRNE